MLKEGEMNVVLNVKEGQLQKLLELIAESSRIEAIVINIDGKEEKQSKEKYGDLSIADLQELQEIAKEEKEGKK